VRSSVCGLSPAALVETAITQRLIADYCRRPEPGALPEAAATLSERELDVLRRVARGRSNAEIAGLMRPGGD
jgi:DNA-binding NarL/FixJ family response regulator